MIHHEHNKRRHHMKNILMMTKIQVIIYIYKGFVLRFEITRCIFIDNADALKRDSTDKTPSN